MPIRSLIGQLTDVKCELLSVFSLQRRGALLSLWCPRRYWAVSGDAIQLHDDVVKWKHFPRYGPPLCAGNSPVPVTKASDVEFWCFLLSASEQIVQLTIETPVITKVVYNEIGKTIATMTTPMVVWYNEDIFKKSCSPEAYKAKDVGTTAQYTNCVLLLWNLVVYYYQY